MTLISRKLAGLTAAAPQDLGTVDPGVPFSILKAIIARNWASIAKGGAGTDAAIRISLTDANDVIYLDAADRDYATAEVTLYPTQDDTATGLGTLAVDATGAAATAGAGADIVVKGTVNVDIVNGATATDYFEIELVFEV